MLGQAAVPDKTDEIGAVDDFLLPLALEGRVVAADALLTQRAPAQTVLDHGGDHLLVVEDNQTTLRWEIETLFGDEAALADTMGVAEHASQHGGRPETRRLAASAALVGYTDWPDATFDEDRSAARAGTVPQAMAAFRDVAIGLLRLLGETNIAACRRYAAQPTRPLAAVGLRGDFE